MGRCSPASQAVLDVADGGSTYAVAPLTLILEAQGIEPAAIFPSEVGADIDISVFINARSYNHSTARRLLDHLTGPAAIGALASWGITRFELK